MMALNPVSGYVNVSKGFEGDMEHGREHQDRYRKYLKY